MKSLGAGFSYTRIFTIKEFELQSFKNDKWDTFYAGDLIGACKTINFPEEISTTKIRLKILQSSGPPSISHFAVSKKSSAGIPKLNQKLNRFKYNE